MCLGDWKSHGSEYYECSRYKENPNIAYESVHAQAREALKKYLHYYERVRWPLQNIFEVILFIGYEVVYSIMIDLFQWENHSKSLRLEEQTLQRIKDRIEAKVRLFQIYMCIYSFDNWHVKAVAKYFELAFRSWNHPVHGSIGSI